MNLITNAFEAWAASRVVESYPLTQHYIFAHKALPQVLAGAGEEFVNRLAGPQGSQVLLGLWGKSGERAEQTSPAGLGCTKLRTADGRLGLLIRFPTPFQPTQAYFAAMVPNSKPGDPAYRYFTLELGEPLEPSDVNPNFLCEWAGSRHNNFGSGFPVNTLAFLKAIGEKTGVALAEESETASTPWYRKLFGRRN